ncbi:hypothetical protein [Pseudomonas sp. NPDC089569]|uniref:hypothetical protein n=1 Tax=Pseudomonas sp. NPDC089569 TaxID=3390722 RepID=UPI003CFC2B66
MRHESRRFSAVTVVAEYKKVNLAGVHNYEPGQVSGLAKKCSLSRQLMHRAEPLAVTGLLMFVFKNIANFRKDNNKVFERTRRCGPTRKTAHFFENTAHLRMISSS